MKPPSALLYLALAALVLLLGSTPAQASDTRRHGLAGNLGFEDDTDVHTFPQLASRWGNRAGFDLGSGGSDLRGGIVVGDGTAFGLFVHRPTTGDWFAPFDDGSIFLRRFAALPGIAPPSGTTLEDPLPLAGLVVAFPNGFGLGLKIANSMDQRLVRIEEEGEAGAEPRLVDAEEGAQSTSVVIGGGWSSRRTDRTIDLGGHLAFHRFKTVTEGKIRAESSLTPSFDLTGRYSVRRSTTWSWIGLAQLDWRNYQLDLPFFDNLVEETALSLRAAAGPQIDLGTRAQVVGLLWLGYQRQGYALDREVADGSALTGRAGPLAEEASFRTYILPALDVALEVEATDWLLLRAGWSARYLFHSRDVAPETRRDDPLDIGGDAQERRQAVLEHHWGAGLTVQHGGLRVDGSLAPGLLNAGPDFIGGQSPGTFAWVGLSYAWGSEAGGSPEPAAREPPRRSREDVEEPYPTPPASPYYPSPGAPPYLPPDRGGY